MSAPGPGARTEPRDDWAELRRLLVDPEQRELAAMKSRLDRIERVSVEEVAAVLPQAVIHSAGKSRNINEALLPVIEENIALSIRRNPRPLADALFPVMGPAIRRAVAEALKGVMQQIDEVMQLTLSPTGLRWRMEAFRTRTPISQVIFKHTMVYRVDQVFLIHRETGLLLQHAAAGHALVQDPETVSSMLTAIQDFVRDSFKTKHGDTLDEISVGELTVWIEHGPSASLAGVIRGHAPRDLRFVFDDALAAIHHEQAEPLERFTGDTAPFVAAKPHLESCLQLQKDRALQEREGRRFTPAYVLVGVLLVAIAAWAAFHLWHQRRWDGYLARLAQEPGIVVMHAENGWTKYGVTGLRDPLAADPRQFLGDHNLSAASVISDWRPYASLDPPLVLARATRLLQPPDGLTLQVAPEGVLTAAGIAPAHWLADARRLARAVPGVSTFDDRQVTVAERQQIAQLAEKLRTYNILFPEGLADPLPASRPMLADLTGDMTRLSQLGEAAGQAVNVTLVGHTDSSGTEGLNRGLSQRRAETILAALRGASPRANGAAGTDTDAGTGTGKPLTLATRGVSNTDPFTPEATPEDRALNRRVTVQVGLK